jgi:hypothetical protein
MPEPVVGLFVEDRGHAAFVEALVKRIGREGGRSLNLRVITGQCGHGRALDEFKLYQRSVIRSITGTPDFVVVAVDANCKGWNQAKAAILDSVEPDFAPPVVVACPDPHVERWYLADPDSFHQVVGASTPKERLKCERDRYKNQLRDAIRRGGHIPTLGGIEFAGEIVEAMDLYRAGRDEPSLRAFVNDARSAVRRLV